MINKSYPVKISIKNIFTLSIPIFFSNLALPLVGVVDTGLMGNLGEAKYLAATSIATGRTPGEAWDSEVTRRPTPISK